MENPTAKSLRPPSKSAFCFQASNLGSNPKSNALNTSFSLFFPSVIVWESL
jgi:hypothetical protein